MLGLQDFFGVKAGTRLLLKSICDEEGGCGESVLLSRWGRRENWSRSFLFLFLPIKIYVSPCFLLSVLTWPLYLVFSSVHKDDSSMLHNLLRIK